MDIKTEVIRVLDYICDFETDEEVYTSYSLRDDLRLTDEELESARLDINETFSLNLTFEDMDKLDTIHDMIDLVMKRSNN